MTGSSLSLPRKRAKRIPGYLFHKGTGQARVRLNGIDHYLGPFGSDRSKIRYGELIAQHSAGIPLTPVLEAISDQSGLTVDELALAFMKHAATHYLKDGKRTSEWHCFKLVVHPLSDLYGSHLVDEFGPLALKAVRLKMIKKKWARKSINRAVARIRHIFRWGVESEMVQPQTLLKLEAVTALQAGRTGAHDNAPRESVPERHIQAVKADVSPLVADLIEMQRLIGCRSGELLSITEKMLDRSGPAWIANLADHKTAHHGQRRFLVVGPKAQQIMSKYLPGKAGQKLFKMRRTAYCRAVTRSCERLEIPRWVPHCLRHTACTKVREEFDLEHSQAVMGHAKSDQTEEYSKMAMAKAIAVALKIG